MAQNAPDPVSLPATYRSLAEFDAAFFPDPVPGFGRLAPDPHIVGALSAREITQRVLTERPVPPQDEVK